MSEALASPAAPGYYELLQRLEPLTGLIEGQADESDKIRHMTDPCYAGLQAQGFFHMMTPRVLGGSELSWSDGLHVAESISQIDGATGWLLMVAGVQHGSCGSLITEAGCRDVFAAGTDTNIAGQGIPRGLARKVDGGYMIKGDWSYGSGIYHSNWIHSGCVLMEDGKPLMDDHGGLIVIITYVPRSAIDLKDNWDVIGLRGTGSFDYSIAEERFVPDDFTYVYSKSTVERGGNHYSLGIVGFTAWGHTSFALGVGRHALNELRAIAKGKAGPFGVLADSASFQEKYARAEAQYRAARAFVYSAWNDLDESLLNEEPPTNEQLALIKLAFRYSHEVMSDVCTFAFNFGGGIALRASPLQRCYRDMHAGLQHILLSDQIMQDCGKVLMGHVPEGARMQLLGLH
ncbi:MAG: acyl-CoA dehydrogenase family protein [Proteobacteria bacterium]|nr:acyl-CoA dehydrogenase family protein [Pseudomonadota bacterium]